MSEKPPQYLNPKAYYIHVLSSVLGSEKAAEDALIYSYGVISGFAAKLNPEQASHLKDQPGIIYVSREIKYQPEENHASTVWPNLRN
ncbi:PREDICTED: subtilisin-like protease SBT3.5 [Erythranthe guttata]|uniref:subtilisin-like protease SBT3.5 n=1 Tax=Erythranthe guttata TaxID=4155 RepID=UPI00064DD58D|nr:PREDICTED: subtilisin-like protease SBT3.5 [Erythranthe guttata]|eukprot:XP_012853446.1 PREDICTED: subtilisin-like protease SBT3.5 [Erythranthe guttata]